MPRKSIVGRAGRSQRLLVQGRCHQRCDLATQGSLRGPGHATPRQSPCLGADLPRRDGRREGRHGQHRHATRRHVQGLGGAVQHDDRHIRVAGATHPGRGAAQDRRVTRDEAAGQQIRGIAEGLHDDFRADAGGVAQGDGQRSLHDGQAGLSISMNSWARPSWAATWPATAGAPYRSLAW